MRASIAVIGILLTVAACGGGGGNPVVVPIEPEVTEPDTEKPPPESEVVELLPFPLDPWVGRLYDPDKNITYTAAAFPHGAVHYGADKLPPVRGADVSRTPVYYDAPLRGWVPRGNVVRRIFAGIDQSSEALGNLPVVGSRGATEIRHGQLTDGAGREVVLAYLQTAGLSPSSDAGPLLRWDRAPTVSYGGAVNAADYQRLLRAVQLVNAALPSGYRMTVESVARTTRPGSGIFVDFDPRFPAADKWGRATNNFTGTTMTASHVQISKRSDNPYDGISDRQATILIAHELLHALGLYGDHVSGVYTGTILRGTSGDYSSWAWGERQPMSLLWPADRETLRALYGELAGGEGVTDLGPWSDTSLHIHGNTGHVGFGVALRNGYAEPWAYGYLPQTDLAYNRELGGSALWQGTLLGFSEQAPVAGDAAISVGLATLTGRAAFTGLETWAANAAPGEAGTGTQWGDGDLAYLIAVTGNTFHETGGDAGRLTGIFTGAAHEGAAGTLERSDLTAAFGASR